MRSRSLFLSSSSGALLCGGLCLLGLSGEPEAAKGKAAFVWTENPSLDKAPADAVSANLDGQPLDLKNIAIESGDRSWTLSARADNDFMSVGPRIALFQTPTAGSTQTSKMADGCHGSFVQLADPSRGPKATTSFNGACAFTVQITKWEVKPYQKSLRGQVVGTASGRLVAVWKGSSSHKDNWIAGTFTGIPVKYGSYPPMCAAACNDSSKYNPPSEWTAKATPAPSGKAAKLVWGPKPALEMAPPGGVTADLNGAKMQLPKVYVYSGEKNWVLALQNEQEDGPNFGATINLWQTPATGALFKKDLEQHVAPASYTEYSVNVPDPGNPKESGFWSGDLAYAVQFTKWDAKPWSASLKENEAGKASGRVVVMMKGEEGSKNSWIAGTFTDVPINYQREPPLCAKTCMAE